MVARAQARQDARRALRRRADRARAYQIRRGVRARRSLRAPPGAAACRRRRRRNAALLLSRVDLRLRQRPLRRRAVSRPRSSAERRARISVPRSARVDLRVSRRCDARRRAAVPRARVGGRSRVQDAPLRPRGQVSLLVHAREPDGHEPSVPAPQADGADACALGRPSPRRRLGRGRLHVLADGRQAAGRRSARVRFEQEAGRPGEQERDDGTHRLSVSDAADPFERRHARDGSVDRLRAARRGAAHEPHVRAAVDPQARRAVRARYSHGRCSCGSPSASSARIAGSSSANRKRTTEQGADWNHEVFPVINELRDLLRHCGARTVIPIREASDNR
ncbi:Phenylpropionate dioxygenase [Burkholderia dolosa AU0158]|nr:Phenylpropionate dioxygenase [Burkholderia dolosa AU0158]